jgi:urease accessory protein
MAYVYLMSPSGGILQGDRLRIDIRLENNAQAHITTQAATKVYRMNRNYATQMINVFVGDNCYLELVPDQLIPYKNARFYQRVQMQVHENATAVYAEIITPGRVASGEYFEYDICYLKATARDQNSRLRFIDALLLEPEKQELFDGFGLRSKSVFANMYILTKSVDANTLSDAIHDILNKSSVNGSASMLPRSDGVSARIIASTTGEIKSAIDIILNKIRKDILSKRFTGARKY